MRIRVAGFATVLLSAVLIGEAARADCNCLYNGQRYEQEETVCMRTPQGMRLARCGMLGNVAWWQVLDQTCPGTVSALPAERAPRPFTPPVGSAERRDAAFSM
jgi:hypothetical protein